MRIKINFTKNTQPLPINNQSFLNTYIHKCLGANNEFHDAKNDYSISGLQGGRMNEDKATVSFENGSYIVVTSLNSDFVGKIITGVLTNPEMGYGMKFKTIDHISEEFVNGWNHFNTLSPVLIKSFQDKTTYSFNTIKDENFSEIVKDYLIKKLTKIDSELDLTGFNVSIVKHPAHKVKKILVKNVINHASKCHISIFTNKKVAEIIYNHGLGQSTGSGFGTIYKTENHKLY